MKAPANTEQIRQFHAILAKNGLMDEKKDIVMQISNDRCTSTKELTYEELQEWIDSVNRGQRSEVRSQKNDPRQRMINSIIAMAREMDVIVRKSGVDRQGKVVVFSHYLTFNKWMIEKSYLKKELRDYTYEELPTLVTQYKNIYLSWLKKGNK